MMGRSLEVVNETASPPPADAPTAPASSAESALQARISELEAQVKEREQKYLYLYAELDNFKKRAIRERSEALKYGWEPLARELLQVIDNLERAVEHTPPGTSPTLVDGLQLVLFQFRDALRKQGVEAIPAQASPFDPHLHEAVVQEPSEQPVGTILKEHSRGYTLHGRLLRPARVVVSGGAPPAVGAG